MISTFTPNLNNTATKLEKEYKIQLADPDSYRDAEPSVNVINTILNFSKNLEIKKSRFVDDIEIMKS